MVNGSVVQLPGQVQAQGLALAPPDAAGARARAAASALRAATHSGAARGAGEGAARRSLSPDHTLSSRNTAGHASGLSLAAGAAAPRRAGPPRERPVPAPAAAGLSGAGRDAGQHRRHGLAHAVPQAGAARPEAALPPGADTGASPRGLVLHADAPSLPGLATAAASF